MAIKESLKRLFSETWVKIVSGVIASLFLIFFGSLLKYSKQIINSFILIPPILLVVFGILELFVISLLIVLLIVIYNKYKSIVVTEEFQTHFSVLWRIDKKNKRVDEMQYFPS